MTTSERAKEPGMRILHVSDAYLPKQGGIEVQVGDLARRQAEAGHEVTVLTCAPDEQGRRPRAGAGVPPAVESAYGGGVPEIRVGIPWSGVPAANDQMYALLRRERPDVVHAHLSVLSPLSMGYGGAALSTGRRRPSSGADVRPPSA